MNKNILMKGLLSLSLLLTLAPETVYCEEKMPGIRTTYNITAPGETEPSLTGVDSQGRPNGMDDATWMRLQDNVIEYDEIPNLVEYRSIIAKQQTAAVDNYAVNMNQIVDSISDSITEIRDQISDLKDAKKDETDAAKKAEYDAQIKALNRIITNSDSDAYTSTLNVSRANAKNSLSQLVSSIKKNMHATKVSVTTGINSAFVGYQSLMELQNMYQKQVDMYSAMHDRALRQQAVGTATAIDVKNAEIKLKEAEISLSSNAESLRSVKENMALILGWDHADLSNVSLGSLPQYDPYYIYSRDLNADIHEAQLHNVEYGSAQAMAKPDITGYGEVDIKRNSTRQNLNITMTDLYNGALEAGAEYESAKAGYMVAKKQKESSERSFAAGLVSTTDYYGAITQYIVSEAQANISAINASSAVLQYQAALKGFV